MSSLHKWNKGNGTDNDFPITSQIRTVQSIYTLIMFLSDTSVILLFHLFHLFHLLKNIEK